MIQSRARTMIDRIAATSVTVMFVVVAIMGAIYPRVAFADDDAGAPIAALDAALLTAMKAGSQQSFAQRSAAMAPAIDAAFDLPGILRGAVGPRWAGLPGAQQQALLAAFRQFTIASYAGNFDSFDGQTIVLVPPARAVGADRIVQTNIVSAGKTDRIDYQMRQIDGAWKAEDVLLDGSISNVAVQRSDFRRLLSEGDASRLIASLNKRAADLASGSAS